MSTFRRTAVTIDLEVTDEQALCQAAKERAIAEGCDKGDELLGTA